MPFHVDQKGKRLFLFWPQHRLPDFDPCGILDCTSTILPPLCGTPLTPWTYLSRFRKRLLPHLLGTLPPFPIIQMSLLFLPLVASREGRRLDTFVHVKLRARVDLALTVARLTIRTTFAVPPSKVLLIPIAIRKTGGHAIAIVPSELGVPSFIPLYRNAGVRGDIGAPPRPLPSFMSPYTFYSKGTAFINCRNYLSLLPVPYTAINRPNGRRYRRHV